jgi:hypothetical protein
MIENAAALLDRTLEPPRLIFGVDLGLDQWPQPRHGDPVPLVVAVQPVLVHEHVVDHACLQLHVDPQPRRDPLLDLRRDHARLRAFSRGALRRNPCRARSQVLLHRPVVGPLNPSTRYEELLSLNPPIIEEIAVLLRRVETRNILAIAGEWDLSTVSFHTSAKDIPQVNLSQTPAAIGAAFDAPNLIASAGLVPLIALAEAAGLSGLVSAHVSVPTDKGANADLKTMSLVAGMCSGADSIQDMSILRHGALGKTFVHRYAPSTLGSFLRQFRFGHVRQLDAVASRFLAALAEQAPLLAGIDGLALVDLDDTIIEVPGHGKQGASFGYSGLRGLNAAAATVTAPGDAPVIVATRLRKGSANSAKGSARIVADALGTVRRLRSADATGTVLLRADSAYFGRPTVLAAVKGGAKVSVTVRQNTLVQRAIESIPAGAWTTIEYPEAIRDDDTGRWVSRAEVAEIPLTALASAKSAQQVPGRLVVRRIADLNPPADPAQAALFDVWRFHALFTTVPADVMDTVAADKAHRGHAIIEQVFDASWAPPSPTCPPAGSTRTPRGSSLRSSRST